MKGLWNWLKRAWRWICERTKDLLYNTGNEHLDQSRLIGVLFAGLATFAVYWNAIVLGKEIDLAALLGGLTALSGGIAGLILGKEWARRKAEPQQETYKSTVEMTTNSEPEEEVIEGKVMP